MRLITFLKKEFISNTFILPVISGILLMFTLPPFNISLFLWFFLIPLLFFIDNDKVNKKRVFQGGFIVGVIYFSKVVYPLLSLNAWWWFDVSGIIYQNKVLFLFWVLYFAVLYASIFFGVFSLLYKRFRKHNFMDILLFPTIWVIFEFIRAKTLYGFTWGYLGYALNNNIYIIQIAKFFNVYGLSFFIIIINILIYLIIIRYIYCHRSKNSLIKFIIKDNILYFLSIVFFSVYLYGFISVNKIANMNRTERVSIIQPGLKTESINKNSVEYIMSMIYKSLNYRPDIIVLPENTIPYLVIDRKKKIPFGYGSDAFITKIYNELLSISLKNKVSIILGLHSKMNKKEYNSVVVIAKGRINYIYDKRILLPFSESSSSFFKTTESLNSGNQNKSIKIKGSSVNILICSEILYPELLDKNTKFIINVGNDGVFDNPIVAQQNHIIAKISAVESEKYVIRSMKTGISSIINNNGEVISKLDFGKNGIINDIIRY